MIAVLSYRTYFTFQITGCFSSGEDPEGRKSAENRTIKRYSQVFVILIDIMQLQNVRVLY